MHRRVIVQFVIVGLAGGLYPCVNAVLPPVNTQRTTNDVYHEKYDSILSKTFCNNLDQSAHRPHPTCIETANTYFNSLNYIPLKADVINYAMACGGNLDFEPQMSFDILRFLNSFQFTLGGATELMIAIDNMGQLLRGDLGQFINGMLQLKDFFIYYEWAELNGMFNHPETMIQAFAYYNYEVIIITLELFVENNQNGLNAPKCTAGELVFYYQFIDKFNEHEDKYTTETIRDAVLEICNSPSKARFAGNMFFSALVDTPIGNFTLRTAIDHIILGHT